MARIVEGDQAAFQALYQRYRGPVWSWLRRRTGDEAVAADLYQEVFLRVWRSAATFRDGHQVRPWLWRIAANTARDRFRASQRQVDTVDVDLAILGERMPNPLATRHIERAIAALPDTLRDAFVLGAVQGMDHNEVAAALDISPANARARIARARARLRTELAPG